MALSLEVKRKANHGEVNFLKNPSGRFARPGGATIYFTRTCPVATGLELSVPSKLRYPVARSVVWDETNGDL
jgi:hypothetical protein